MVSPIFRPAIEVCNTNPALIMWLQTRWVGCLPKPKARNSTANSKPIYRWTLVGMDRIATFLRDVSPYLVLKRPQAEILLEFITTKYAGRPLTQAIVTKRLALVSEARRLNKRGTVVA